MVVNFYCSFFVMSLVLDILTADDSDRNKLINLYSCLGELFDSFCYEEGSYSDDQLNLDYTGNFSSFDSVSDEDCYNGLVISVSLKDGFV